VNGGILDNHCPASVMREKYDDFDQRFVFCFVRNPWHRLISWYSWAPKMEYFAVHENEF